MKGLCTGIPCTIEISTVGWLVGCFGLSGPLREYFSLSGRLPERDVKKGETIEERKQVSKHPHPHLLYAQ